MGVLTMTATCTRSAAAADSAAALVTWSNGTQVGHIEIRRRQNVDQRRFEA